MEIRRIRDERELQAALDLRQEVFCVEQGVTPQGDRDGRDHEAIQLVAVGEDGALLGTCRVLVGNGTAKFGRLAVRRAARGRGVGAALLAEAEREARAAGAGRMGLAAQTRALGLYERAGFSAYGGEFDDEGIPHRTMEKSW
jgi:predicted GNAT family N-acyltransferase